MGGYRKNCMRSLKPSHITVTYVSETDRCETSEDAQVPSEHSGQEECNHVSIETIDSDGYNVIASDNSDTDSDRVAGYEAKYGQKVWNKLPPLLSHHGKHNMNRIEYKEGRDVSVPCTQSYLIL